MIGFITRYIAAGLWHGTFAARPTLVDTISGAGTSSQVNATGLTGEVNRVTTNALNAGVRLPVPTGPNDEVVVLVDSGVANPVLLYPASGGKINGLAANASISVAVGKSARCVAINATDWVVSVSA